jgi:RNA polymerase-associated protein RTF1
LATGQEAMSDVDDEFLALVGGDESDDEVSTHSRAASPAPGSDGEAQTSSKARRRKANDSDEEEGEA